MEQLRLSRSSSLIFYLPDRQKLGVVTSFSILHLTLYLLLEQCLREKKCLSATATPIGSGWIGVAYIFVLGKERVVWSCSMIRKLNLVDAGGRRLAVRLTERGWPCC